MMVADIFIFISELYKKQTNDKDKTISESHSNIEI